MVISSVTVMPIIIQDATRVSHIMASHHDAWANEKICRTSFASVRYVSAEGGNGHIQRCESCARLGTPVDHVLDARVHQEFYGGCEKGTRVACRLSARALLRVGSSALVVDLCCQ